MHQGDPPPPSSQDPGGSQQQTPHRQPQQQRQPPQQQDSRGGDMTGSHLGHNVGPLATIDLTVPAPAALPGCARPPFLFPLHPTSHAQQAAQRPMLAQQPQHPTQYYQPPPQHRQQQQQQQPPPPRQPSQPPPYRQQEQQQQQPPQDQPQQPQQPQQGRGYWLMRPPATNTGGGSASRSGENHGSSSSQVESAPLDWSASSDGGFGEAGPGSEGNERRPLEASLPLSPYPMPLYHATNSLNLPPVFLGPHDPLLDYLSVFDQSGDSNGSGSGGGDEDQDRNPSPTDDRVSVSSSLTASSQPQPPSFSSASGPAQPPHAGGGGQAHPSQAVFRPWALARQLSGGPSGGPPPRPPAFQRSSTSSSGHPPMGGFLEPGSRPTGPPLLVRTTSSGYSLSLSLPGRSGSYLSDSGGGGASVGSIGSSMSREDLLAAIPLVPEPVVGPPGAPPVPFRSLSHLLPAAPPPQHPPFFQRAHTAPSPSYPREMGGGYQPLPHPSSLLNVPPGVTLEAAWAELEPEKRSEYRRRCVLRWLHKRKRRKADRGVQYSERSLLAHKRHRVSGRFVRQTTTFVAVTALDRGGQGEGASGRETPEVGERQGEGASGGGGGAAASSRARGRRQRKPARGRGRGRGREEEEEEEEEEDSEFEAEEEDESSSDEEYGRRRKGRRKKGR